MKLRVFLLGLTPSTSESLGITGLGTTKPRFSLRSLSDSSDEEEDASEPDLLLDMNGAFAVGFTGTVTVRVTGGPHPSRLPANCNLKPLDYNGLAPAD